MKAIRTLIWVVLIGTGALFGAVGLLLWWWLG